MINSMENRQSIFLFLGFCLFTFVIYLLSVQKSGWTHKSLSADSSTNFKLKLDESQLSREKPNFVLILTDDQDLVLDSMQAMKSVQELVMRKGMTFTNSFVASPLCCPSRSSILSGQYVHNHKALNNSLSGGCSNREWQKGPERRTFVNSLHQSGYHTFFAGKYLNQYGKHEAGGLSHVPPGWDWWVGLEGNSKYYNYNVSVNGTREEHLDNPDADYFTNVIRRQALNFLDANSAHSKPFFMMLSTPACHAPFEPEPKYEHDFGAKRAPRTDSFNVANGGSKHWLLRLGEQPLRQEYLNELDEIYRKRLRTLLTVDDMVSDVMEKLRSMGVLDSTYVIFTSDNGYHLGQFSMPLDKREPYEFDIRVPFFIRGPGVVGSVSEHPVSNIDIAPTVLDLAGIPIPPDFDGQSFKPQLESESFSQSSFSFRRDAEFEVMVTYKEGYASGVRRNLLVEHSGEGNPVSYGCEHLGSDLYGCDPEFSCKCSDSKNNTYTCLRHLSEGENFLFCLWKDDEQFEELYDLEKDFWQLNNTAQGLPPDTRKRLVAILNDLQKCRGAQCRKVSNFVI